MPSFIELSGLGEAMQTSPNAFLSSYVVDGLERYKMEGIPTGSFLQAVLRNDLRDACGAADRHHIATLWAVVSYCYNEMPSGSWGSPEAYEQWIKSGGLNGQARSHLRLANDTAGSIGGSEINDPGLL